ncbi:MAG TPA: autotransporter-associated beta strand repeat-containing protein [Verrucomicrobiae bacterium]
MRISSLLKLTLSCLAVVTLGRDNGLAQTATWIGPATGGEWNTAASWDLGVVPGATTNVFIGAGTNVSYNSAMAAASIASLTNRGTLNINAANFNLGSLVMNQPAGGAKMFLNNGAVANLTGNFGVTSNDVVTLASGATLNISGSLFVGSGTLGGSGSGTVGCNGLMTNNGAVLNASATGLNPANQSVSANCLLVINSGVSDLGNVTINRATGGNNAPPALGLDGLVIYGGTTIATNILYNSNSHMTIYQTGGIITNWGSFLMKMPTASRTSRFVQTGGLFVNPTTNIIQLAPSASGAVALYQVTGGTNIVGGFQFGDSVPSVGTVTFTVGAPVYIGAGGIVSNGAASVAASLNSGGKIGALADFTNLCNLTLNGGVIDTSDLDGGGHTIYSMGALKTGALVKTGAGTLTLTASNTTSSSTVNAGTLALAIDSNGSAGSVNGNITVASNAVLDVSGLASLGGYTLGSGRTLAGGGTITGQFTAGASSTLSPAGSGAQGAISFATGLALNNATINLELTDNPGGNLKNNDIIKITGDLNLSGVSTIAVTPVGSLGVGTYKLITYTGNLVGGLANLTCASGTLTLGTGEIDLVVTSVRASANLIWRGDGVVNQWDTASSIDWLNGAALDRFYTGDTVTFDDSATNQTVTLFGALTPNSSSTVLVNATKNYTLTGDGSISGSVSLTKTNTGTLTINATNTFSGGVKFNGGVLVVPSLADDGTPSPLGQSGTLSFNGGALDYEGANFTWTRSITLGAANGTIAVANTLTQGGTSVYDGTGALVKTGAGVLALNNANTYSGGTVLNAGTLALNNAAAAGSANITLNGGILALGAVKPANTINVAASSEIMGGNSGGNTGIKAVTGTANLLLAISGGSTFDLTGDMSAYGGSITFSNAGGSFVRLFGSTGSSLATFDLGVGPMDLNVRSGSTNNNIGALKGAAGTTLSGRGGSSNNGPTTYFIGGNNLSTEFDGVIQNGGGGSSSTTAINKVGAGTLTLSAAQTYSGPTTITGGTLALINSGSVNNTPAITIGSGAVLDISALPSPTLVLNNNQSLSGQGTVLGAVDAFSGGGFIAPGGGVNGTTGTLTVTNNILLGGTTWMKLNRTNSATSDRLVSSLSTITYAGTLTVTNIGPALQAGDTFTLFSAAGGFNGTLDTTNLPDLNPGLFWIFNGVAGQLVVGSSVNTAPTNLVSSISGNALTLSWPADHTGWRLQVQTNTVATGLGGNWIDVAGAAATNSVTATLDPAQGAVFYRLVYP